MLRETRLDIAADHPAFAGHFPGMPIVPGVVLLDEALFALEAVGAYKPDAAAWTIATAKFFHPVGPGAMLVLRHEQLANGSIRFEISAGARKIAAGSLVPRTEGGGPG